MSAYTRLQVRQAMQRHVREGMDRLNNYIFATSAATSTGSITGYNTPVIVNQTIEQPPSPADIKKAKAAETRRRKKKVDYLGKFIFIEPGAEVGPHKTGEYLCVKESERNVYCIHTDPCAKSIVETPFAICLDRRTKGHFIVVSIREDEELLNEIVESYSKFIQTADFDTSHSIRQTARLLFPIVGLPVPKAPKRLENAPSIVNGQLVFSQKMQAQLRLHFCTDYQKKVTPLLQQMYMELLTLVFMPEAKETMLRMITNGEPPEKIFTMLTLPAPEENLQLEGE